MPELATMHFRGPWNIQTHVTRAMCEDGRRRYARITSTPDTFFSIPARVQVQGKTVSGFITGTETDDFQQDYKFVAYDYGKNGHLLKQKEAA